MEEFFQVHHFDSEAFELLEKRLQKKIRTQSEEISKQLDRKGQEKLLELMLTYMDLFKILSLNYYALGFKDHDYFGHL